MVHILISPYITGLNSLLYTGAAPMTPQELSALSPTAAATSSLLKKGMTLTQVQL